MHASSLSSRRQPKGRRVNRRGLYALRLFLTGVTLLAYAVLAPWGYALFAVIAALPIRNEAQRRKILQRAIRGGFRTLITWLGILRLFEVRMPAKVCLPSPCVVVANHPTHLDIVSLLGWIPDCCTIVKPSIYRFWWLRPLMKGSGQIEGSGSGLLEAARLIERAEDSLRQGQTIVVFPEGTRTEEGQRMPFHRLAFEIACAANVPVTALHIGCEPPYLSKSRSVLRPPRIVPRLTVELIETLCPGDFESDSRRLRDYVRSLYTASRARLRA